MNSTSPVSAPGISQLDPPLRPKRLVRRHLEARTSLSRTSAPHPGRVTGTLTNLIPLIIALHPPHVSIGTTPQACNCLIHRYTFHRYSHAPTPQSTTTSSTPSCATWSATTTAPPPILVYIWLSGEQARRATPLRIRYQELAESTGLSRSAAQAAVAWLKRRKLLSATKDNATDIPTYTLHIPWRRPGPLH